MKKTISVIVSLIVLLGFQNSVQAQQVKIGYFDDQVVLSLFPGIQGKVDTALRTFLQDTLQEEYEYTLREYQRKDSSFKLDSASLKPIQRELELTDINKLRYKLVNWQQYQQQILQQKQEEILKPYQLKIFTALNEIVEQQKYTWVLTASSLSPYVQPPLQDNLSIPVALKLKLEIPKDILDAYNKAKAGGSGFNNPGVKKP
ncbi:MAG: OmpH family outer membrane protein [Sediminibacterium sp.]|nr:OmpH family outer membrane protein [Sediminibacterium sp.]